MSPTQLGVALLGRALPPRALFLSLSRRPRAMRDGPFARLAHFRRPPVASDATGEGKNPVASHPLVGPVLATPDDAVAAPRLEFPKERVSALSTPCAARAIGRCATEWVLVIAAVVLCETFWSWPLYILAVVWIGARQHALLVLMHDAVHYRLLPWRRAADTLSDLLCAWPLLISTDGFRRVHFQHHRHAATEQDPDWRAQQEEHEYRLPKSWLGFALLFLRDISGLGVLRQLRTVIHVSRARNEQRIAPRGRARLIARLGFYAVFATVATASGGWQLVLIYWVVPFLTWLKWTLYLRSVAEHHGLEGGGELLASTRTTLTSLLGRWLIAPHNINYHVEHHLYPSVPSFQLPKLHRELMAIPAYRARARLARGYFAVLRECVAFRPNATKSA